MSKSKSLQERLEEAKRQSPANEMSPQRIAVTVANIANKTGVPTEVKPWNKGLTMTERNANYGVDGTRWGKTRQARAAQMTEEERRRYYGVKDQHSQKTKQTMSKSAEQRWQKDPRRVRVEIEGEQYLIEEAGEKFGIHKDTVNYRCKSLSEQWKQWRRLDRDET